MTHIEAELADFIKFWDYSNSENGGDKLAENGERFETNFFDCGENSDNGSAVNFKVANA